MWVSHRARTLSAGGSIVPRTTVVVAIDDWEAARTVHVLFVRRHVAAAVVAETRFFARREFVALCPPPPTHYWRRASLDDCCLFLFVCLPAGRPWIAVTRASRSHPSRYRKRLNSEVTTSVKFWTDSTLTSGIRFRRAELLYRAHVAALRHRVSGPAILHPHLNPFTAANITGDRVVVDGACPSDRQMKVFSRLPRMYAVVVNALLYLLPLLS